jgi:S-DNA-T family DNA segregation ATPase FtsK/SpoIIIE
MSTDHSPTTRTLRHDQRAGRGLLGRLRDRWAAQRRLEDHRHLEDDLRGLWREACTGVGLCQYIAMPTGVTVRTPKFGALRTGPGVVFSVELLPGGEPDDITGHADRLAHSLGAHGLRVEPLAGRWVRIVLLRHDPLRESFRLPPLTNSRADEPVLLGRTEDGRDLLHVLAEAVQLAVQGQNGGGKSAFLYGLLSQVCGAPDVLVAGSDITGLLLGRAWNGTAHRPWQAVGTKDLEAHASMLEDLAAEMDRRLDAMPPRQDKVRPTVQNPLVLVVLEEFPGLLRAAQAKDKKLAERITSVVLRLVSEGRKAAFRVLMLAQRFEANAVGGGYARDQFALRLSFRVPGESLVMLHGEEARSLGPTHANAEPGVAYLSAPVHELVRVRVPYLGSYGEYCDRITRHGRRDHTTTEGRWAA